MSVRVDVLVSRKSILLFVLLFGPIQHLLVDRSGRQRSSEFAGWTFALPVGVPKDKPERSLPQMYTGKTMVFPPSENVTGRWEWPYKAAM